MKVVLRGTPGRPEDDERRAQHEKGPAMARTAFVDGIGLWAPSLPGWAAAAAAFRRSAGDIGGAAGGAGEGAGDGVAATARRPAPALLPAAERRRAPDTVAIALEVAAAAVLQSQIEPGELLSVFTSAHGDSAINDALCRTLAADPNLLSPVKFHNSVHNAASGYWGIATGCRQASTAVTAFDCSFAAGLLEALTQCAADDRPVLLVGYDIPAAGALASTNESRGLLAVALVVSPHCSARSIATLGWSLASGPTRRLPLGSSAALALADNAISDALPLFEALARANAVTLALPLSAQLALKLDVRTAT